MSSPELFEPQTLYDNSIAIVINNHLGGTVRMRDGSVGDTGRDAQAIANHTGRLVIAHNRIGSGDDANFSEQHVYDPRRTNDTSARQWAEEVLPFIERSGVDSVHLLGKSVGATPLLAVAKQDILPISGICAVEPIGFTRMSSWQAKARVAAYKLIESCFSCDDSSTVETLSTGKLRRVAIDIAHNQAGWRSTDALNAIGILGYAPQLRHIAVHLAFAGMSLAGLRSELNARINLLHVSRQNLDTTPLSVSFVPGTTHRSFNSAERYIAQYVQLDRMTKQT